MTSRRRAWLAAGAGVLAACGSQAGATPRLPDGAAGDAPVPVRIAPVATEMLTEPVVATGTLGPKDQIALSFKLGGVVERVAVDVGDEVTVGQTLATLHPEEIEAALRRARSAAAQAERELARADRLYADSVVTKVHLESATTAAEIARADLAAARFNRRHSVIRAPADGVILRRLGEPGEVLQPGAPVLVFGSRARGAVLRVGVTDRDLVRLRRGDAAIVGFDALPDRKFEGRVSEIAAAAEPGTGTYAVEIDLPGAVGLAAGLVGQVEIRPAALERTTVIPVEAILEADDDRATVFALSDDGKHAERRQVTVGFIDGSHVTLQDGLEGVDAVVTQGAAYIDDGAAVRVVP